MTTFDPYYKWLAIPPENRPINHYELLGLRQFESDIDVIINAAEQRMVHVKSFSNGPYATESQQILNELSQAKVCLANPQSKTAYDATLNPPRPVPLKTSEAAVNPYATSPPANEFLVSHHHDRKSRSGATGMLLALFAVGLMALLMIPVVLLLFGSSTTTVPTTAPVVTSTPADTDNQSSDDHQNSPTVDSPANQPADPRPSTLPPPNNSSTAPEDPAPIPIVRDTGNRNAGSSTRATPPTSSNNPIKQAPPRANDRPDRTPISDPPANPTPNVLPSGNDDPATDGNPEPAAPDETNQPLPPGLINELDSGITAIFEHRYPDYRNHISFARNMALQSRLQKAITEVRQLEGYYNAYAVVWDEVQTALKSLQAGGQITIGKAMAAVVQSEPQQLVLFANRTHKKYLGRRAGTSIVFYDMPKPLIMHLAKLPGTDTKRAKQSIQFIDSVDPAVLPKDPKERWEQLKVLWIKSGATDAGRPDDDLPTQDVVPTPQIREAQLISEDGVHTNKFNFDVEEDSQLELTNVEQVERLQVVQINLGRKLGQLDVPPELQYIRAGTPWRLEGDRDIPVTLILSLKSESDKNPTLVASATYQMVMARSKREYPLHLPEIRKKTATVENALRKHLRKAKSHEVVINEIKQQIAQVARTRIPTNGPGALAAAQQKQAALTGLNETLSKKGIAYKNVMKQVNRSQAQLESFKSIAEFAQDMQSGGWIQVKVFEN